jgi:lipopolysaccharide/colanic/teichoic acid biosynthesis glycosyltransferase
MVGVRGEQANGPFGGLPGIVRAPCRLIGRVVEFLLALVLLAFMAPSLLTLALLLKTDGPGPLLVREPRIGRGGRTFQRLIFRTTSPAMEPRLKALLATSRSARIEYAATGRLKNDPRLTSLGRFLRLSRIEEAPQLLNVLKGEMSLVGPEPIRPEAVAAFGPRFSAYASLRPGMTGLWQVRRLRPESFRRRVALDVLYARRKSVILDIGIVLASAPTLLFPAER